MDCLSKIWNHPELPQIVQLWKLGKSSNWGPKSWFQLFSLKKIRLCDTEICNNNVKIWNLMNPMKSKIFDLKINTLRLRQNGRHFANDLFKRIFVNEKVRIFVQISLKFILECPINNNQHWFRWWLGAKKATSHYLNQWWSSLLMHIWVTRPQWVKSPDTTSCGMINFNIYNTCNNKKTIMISK